VEIGVSLVEQQLADTAGSMTGMYRQILDPCSLSEANGFDVQIDAAHADELTSVLSDEHDRVG
jgi:hypothetical protein